MECFVLNSLMWIGWLVVVSVFLMAVVFALYASTMWFVGWLKLIPEIRFAIVTYWTTRGDDRQKITEQVVKQTLNTVAKCNDPYRYDKIRREVERCAKRFGYTKEIDNGQ